MNRRINDITRQTRAVHRGSRQRKQGFPVTAIGISRIEERLDKIIPHLDMSDYGNRPTQRRNAELSRALAAFCVKILGNTDDKTAAASVTDEFQDRQIDAIYFDVKSCRLLIVNSKWPAALDWKDARQFCESAQLLVKPSWESFQGKIAARSNEITTAMKSSARVELITIHAGPNEADVGVRKNIDDLAEAFDGGNNGEIAQSFHLHQRHVLEWLKLEVDPPQIDADLFLANWGQIRDPYHAVFGRIQGQVLADLWKAHPHLAHMNIRDYGRNSNVNATIAKTVASEPENFWYFNNGVTLICKSITPKVYGNLNHDGATFRFEGISLVNGAQSTGIVSDHLGSLSDPDKAKLWVQVRAIAIKGCPDQFEKRVTKFTNLQNSVTLHEFVSLDPIQSRIAADFAMQKRRYDFRWGGDAAPTGEQGTTLREATLALACAEKDPWFAVQAKKEIGVLWDTEEQPYKTLFHENLTAKRVWNAVKILRTVEAAIEIAATGGLPRSDLVASHLQRIIAHLVFQDQGLSGWDISGEPAKLASDAVMIAAKAFEKVREYTLAKHPNEYLASLHKNAEKCRALVAGILSPVPTSLPPRAGPSVANQSLDGQKSLFRDDDALVPPRLDVKIKKEEGGTLKCE